MPKPVDVVLWDFTKKMENLAKENDIYAVCLHYNIKDNSINQKQNEISYNILKDLCANVDDSYCIKWWTFSRNIDAKKYVAVTRQTAGRPANIIFKDDAYSVYSYADILYMKNQGMTDNDVAKKINMPIATFKRFLQKKMMSSVFVKRLDNNKLNDMEYLNSQLKISVILKYLPKNVPKPGR